MKNSSSFCIMVINSKSGKIYLQMNEIELKSYYPAIGNVNNEIEITNIQKTKQLHVLSGNATLPCSVNSDNVLIFIYRLSNGKNDYRVVSALCPHQGADITNDELKADGNVYCSWHRRPICIYGEYNDAYPVEKRGEQYFIVNK